ncbi:MAG: sigma-70 family RNA polymerase sigma factor [Candidatus Eremiobacteraeota bacterium]|nr:sigma-70 family RNA polymerase sigma factor [Candidatus Eremiobacteraeota bacterium]
MRAVLAAPLDVAHNAEFVQYREERSLDQRDALVLRHMPLVKRVAGHYARDPASRDDLTQVGYVGLIKAVENFDPTMGVPFEAYARPMIAGEIAHYLRDQAPVIRVPRWYRGLNAKLNATRDRLHEKLQREPTSEELADAMNVTREGLAELLKLRASGNPISLTQGSETTDGSIRLDAIRSPKLVSFQLPIEDRVTLDMALDQLAAFERRVVYLFFFQDLTQTEIAQQVGSSQRQISRVLAKTLQKMRAFLG